MGQPLPPDPRELLQGRVTITDLNGLDEEIGTGSDVYLTQLGVHIYSAMGASRRIIPWTQVKEIEVH